MQSQVKVRGLIRHLPDVMSVLIVSAVFVTSSYTQTTTQTERLKHTLAGHSAAVSAIAFSPDGQTLAGVDRDGTLVLWDAQTGEVKRSLKNERESFSAVAFSPDGQTLVTGSRIREAPYGMEKAGMVTLRDSQTGEIKRKFSVGPTLGAFRRSGGVFSVAFSPDGKNVAAGTASGIIKIWDAQTGKEQRVLARHSDLVNSLAYSSDGLTLASGSHDETLILWDTKSWKPRYKLKLNNARVRSVAFSPDGKTLASASTLMAKRASPTLVTTNDLPTNGDNVIDVKGYDLQPAGGEVKLWDVETGKALLELAKSQNTIVAVAFSPDGQTVANAVTDNTVRLVTVKNGELPTLKGHARAVIAVAFSPDGRTVASASVDKTVKLWDVSDTKTTR
jgi:WD40 repeat protein